MLVLTCFENNPLMFDNPVGLITCSDSKDISKCFLKIEEALSRGYYVAGFLSYEAGLSFNGLEILQKSTAFPFVSFGIFEKPQKYIPKIHTRSFKKPVSLNINTTKDDYCNNIAKIKSYIAEGDVYQITYCIKFNFSYSGDTYKLFTKLKDKQPVPYPAYIETDDYKILSLSPELFIKKSGEFVATKPMKGTWHRGTNYLDDFLSKYRLKFDKKNRAENVMIADLLRNDLGRIGKKIKAPKLFEVAGYTTLFQMTSTVTCRIKKDFPILDIFKAIHPSGSVTGAPKIRAMEIINEIEKEDRKIYTGAIGYITPQRDLFFNVPIRTLLINGNKGEMGVGGGIVWDSTPKGELEECLLKSKFLFA